MAKRLLKAPSLSKIFIDRVQSLFEEATALAKEYTNLTEKMLTFSKKLHSMENEAEQLDKQRQTRIHRKHFHQEMQKAFSGHLSKADRSKWLTIGENAQLLLPHKKSLPPTKEGLYQLALEAQEKNRIGKWIQQDLLTYDTSVNNVKKLRTPTRKQTNERERKIGYASITLCFKSYTEAVNILLPVIQANKDRLKFHYHLHLDAALKARLEDKEYAEIKALQI